MATAKTRKSSQINSRRNKMMSIRVAQLEIMKTLRHPMTWGIYSLSIMVLSLLFYRLCLDYLQVAQHALHHQGIQASLSLSVFKPLCSWTIMLLAIVIPLFSTQTLSQEFRQKTIYLWAKSPFKTHHILIGKMLSIVFIMLMILFVMLIMMASLAFEISLAWPTISSMLFITALIGLGFICFDLFICSVISNPLFALATCFLGNLLLMLLEWLNPFPLSIYYLAKELSLLSHSYHFLNGILYSPDLIFYLIFCGFWLFFTQRILKNKMRHLV